jgi:hypothetical protein
MTRQESANPSQRNIRTATRDEVDMAVEWAAKEGWNPGLHDAECFYAQDSKGFLVAELNGEVVGCASAVRYDGGFGFAGFYIMRPEFRGHRVGYELGSAAVNRLADVNAGLDGVVKQQPKYVKLWGFQLAHRNVRYELAQGANTATRENAPQEAQLVALNEVPFNNVAAYDLKMFRFSRDAFLRCWISRPGTAAIGARRNGELVGYGIIRPCRKGFKLAPLFADSPDIADALFCELAPFGGNEPVYLDIPQPNPAAVELVRRHGMQEVFETARMYTKGDTGLPLERIFGITSFELG